jgi:hypothetical protein
MKTVKTEVLELLEEAKKATLWSLSFDYHKGLGYFDSPASKLRLVFEADKFLNNQEYDRWHSDMTGEELHELLEELGANPYWEKINECN